MTTFDTALVFSFVFGRLKNKKYKAGLELAIGCVRGRGQHVHVLDIGTGSGLLSMLAAQAGADRVTACECFKPMAGAARKIIKKNGFADKITVIPKRSTDMTAGPGGDMEERANILVAELLDTELIGEGCLYTYQHALKHLVTPDCIFVPHAATVYAQVVESDFMWNWHRLRDLPLTGCEKALVPSLDMEACTGAAAVHDIQLSQVKQGQFKPLTEPIKVFRFEFDKKTESLERQVDLSVTVTETGQAEVVLMWWDIEMVPDSSVLLSVAPSWAHPTPHNMQVVVVMWWDIEMDPDNSVLLSVAPSWAHPTPHNMQVVVVMWWDIEMDPDNSVLLSVAPSWAHPTPHNMQTGTGHHVVGHRDGPRQFSSTVCSSVMDTSYSSQHAGM
ncbi:protein arginine N-methyltransferase 7-like [Branchiostoma lanceolatum]|uniref:protein arginine N-methyltransferase 7-like n=1 Tax=Branchiostoma lanceolatum TaxID=7740 RepID=UPI003456797C